MLLKFRYITYHEEDAAIGLDNSTVEPPKIMLLIIWNAKPILN
jgi:hypothetical protein